MAYPYDDEDKRSALTQGLLAAGLAALGARKGSEYNAFAQAGLLGLGGYQNSLKNATDARESQALQKMREQQWAMTQQEHALKLKAMQDAQAQQQQDQQALPGFFSSSPNLSAMGPGGPTPQNAEAVAPRATPVSQYRAAADYFAKQGRIDKAKEYSAIADKMEEEYSTSPVPSLDASGNTVFTQFGKRGGMKVAQGVTPPPDLQVLNLGDRSLAIDKLRTAPGTSFVTGISPDTKYTGGITMRGQDMTDARSREANQSSLVGKTADAVAAIRKEFNTRDEVKNYNAAAPMVESARNAPDTPAGDLDVIYAVGKALDPNSVVREGELSLVIKSGTPLEQFQGYTRAIAAGKGRLPPAQRQKLIAMLEGRVAQLGQAYSRARTAYEAQADASGLPKEQIFSETPPERAAAPATQKTYETAKSGETYVAPDGTLRRKR